MLRSSFFFSMERMQLKWVNRLQLLFAWGAIKRNEREHSGLLEQKYFVINMHGVFRPVVRVHRKNSRKRVVARSDTAAVGIPCEGQRAPAFSFYFLLLSQPLVQQQRQLRSQFCAARHPSAIFSAQTLLFIKKGYPAQCGASGKNGDDVVDTTTCLFLTF